MEWEWAEWVEHHFKEDKKMKLNELKKFTLFYILEHKNLTKAQKLQLGEFVKEANEDQVNYLLLTGKPCGGKDAKDFIEKNPKMVSEITDVAAAGALGAYGGISAAVLAAYVGTVAGTIWKQYLSKAGRACKGLKGLEKKSCMVKFKRQAVKKQLSVATSSKSKCAKTKDPVVCKRKLDNKIRKLKAKLGEL